MDEASSSFVIPASMPWRRPRFVARTVHQCSSSFLCGCSRWKSQVLRRDQQVNISMGLNAKSMKKAKGKKRKGGGGGSATKTADRSQESRATPSAIDTNKKEYIYQMYRLSKTLPSGRNLLNNINLAFFPGAKIGLVGDNGSGKSSLLKIMAGVDNEFDGEALPQRGIRIGYLEQEPKLLNGATVAENIEASVQEIRDNVNRYTELGSQLAKEEISSEEKEKIEKEMERVQDHIEASNGWELESTVERALDALRCPPGSADVSHLSGGEKRRVAMCALLLKRPELLILDGMKSYPFVYLCGGTLYR